MTTKPILGYLDLRIYTDASGYDIGAVLAQMQTPAVPDTLEKDKADPAGPSDREVVMAYISKHLNEREANWSTTENNLFCYSRDRRL